MSIILQVRGFLSSTLEPLMRVDLQLMKRALKLLTWSILIPLWLTAARSAAGAGIHKRCIDNFIEKKCKISGE